VIRFTPDKCVACGFAKRRTFSSRLQPEIIDEQGTLFDTRFWVCSDECAKTAFEFYLDKRFHFDRTPYDDPSCPDDHIEEFAERWTETRHLAARRAIADLITRCVAEYGAYADKLEAEAAKNVQKLSAELERKEALLEKTKGHHEEFKLKLAIQERNRQDKLRSQAEQLAHKQAVDDERLNMQAERDADSAAHREEMRRLAQERHDLAIQKAQEAEAEKQRKLDEEEAQRLADEEAAKPHDLTAEPITDLHRFEHTQVVAGSGSGKTTLYEHEILQMLKRPNPPGIVVIDPKGSFVDRLQQLAVFDPDSGSLRHRLIVVDPKYKPALNMFDTTGFQINENATVDIYQYMFASKENALTPKMGTLFRFLLRVLRQMKDATIHDLLDLCDDRARSIDESVFGPAIRSLDRTSQRFFEKDYYSKSTEYNSTRDQVKQRIYSLLGFAEIDAAFSSPRRKINMAHALANRSIVLVNCDIDLLSEDACQLWGRTIIGLALAATYNRIQLPRSEWHETFIFVDEAQLFLEEEKTPRFLQLAREYRVGIAHAHQDIRGSITSKMQASLSANTSIKYAASVEAEDLSIMSHDLRCEPEFIRAQMKDDRNAAFACFVRNLMKIPWRPLSREPAMSRLQHTKLIEVMKAKYGVDPGSKAESAHAPPPPPGYALHEASAKEPAAQIRPRVATPDKPTVPPQSAPPRPQPQHDTPKSAPRKPTVTIDDD
jgi:hypothetical protein